MERMHRKELQIVIRAKDEFSETLDRAKVSSVSAAEGIRESFEDLDSSCGELESGARRVEKRFGGFRDSAKELRTALNELGESAAKVSSMSSPEDREDQGRILWFLERDDEKYNDRRRAYFRNSVEWAEALTGRRIELAEKEYTAVAGFNAMHERSAKFRESTVTRAYGAMEDQLLSLVETHRFSVKEFSKAVAQHVKIELTGLAARAAIWAIFETAMGIKDLAFGKPTAALHFKSAAEFTAVAGGALAAAAGVHKAFFGKGERGKGPGGETPKGLSPGPAPVAASNDPEPRKTQHITINVHNPLSEQNWQEIAEQNIAPALRDLKDRNVEITVGA